ncbi:alpha/beta fold hydrolase [Pectobacterium brasiliense]|uniref:alpha/beta fold hydrolase n=1 Tax=Pectobacterium brasiliense TaxID=180957 RepID=UPI000650A74D|nr:alpha/beta hydrolase [Pectobacterium brasiliense]KMK85863.1 putative hydrolase [Pectobacterium brasiliense ICMP 19477]
MLELKNNFIFEGQPVAWGCMGQGPALVLIHGTPFSSQVWRRIAPLLASQWTVYYYDMVGYGQSHKSAGQQVSLGVQDRLLAALLKAWKLTRPDILCHDFGGATALRGYLLQNLRYASLTLFDAVALSPWGSPFVTHVRKHQDAFTGLPEYVHDALLKAYLQGAAYQPLSEEALNIYMSPWQGEVGQAAFYRQIAQMDQCYTDDIESLLTELDCPLNLLWGEQDEWIPLEVGKRLAHQLGDAPLQIVKNAGHLVQEDAPEAIVQSMYSSLLKRSGTPSSR